MDIELASEIITELIEKGFSIELVLADSLYGESSEFIRKLNEYNLAYVVAIRSNYGVWMPSNQRVRANKWCKWEIIFCVYTMISLNSPAFLSLNQSRQTESNLQKSNSVDFSKHQQWNHEMEKSSQ
jgi:SRSO17 transposase